MKDKLTIIGILGPLFLFCILGICTPDVELSKEERRKLEQIPKFSTTAIQNNTYFSKWTNYFTDQFPYRNEFRKLKGLISLNVFQKKTENNVVQIDDTLYEINPYIAKKSLTHFTEQLNKTITTYNNASNIYYSIIPDKTYYLEDKNIPKLDYNSLVDQIKKEFKNYTYISLFEALNKESYFKTDIHWKQNALENVLKNLKKAMNLPDSNLSWSKQEVSPFYGALKSRIPNNIAEETITFYTNDSIEQAIVYNYEKQTTEKAYQKENINHLDGYDVFLSGATALLIIENEHATTNKELIVFRDSFASSLIPLLIPEYQKITLIDLRYIKSEYLKNIPEISFQNNPDILLLYSVPLINNSYTLK